jgi:predicted neutral ceramidase superfamily lipid hydrolase
MPSAPKTGVGGTVDAFNFIRRFAFPSTPRVIAIYAAITIASATVSLLIAGESLVQTLVFAGIVFVLPGLVGELVSSGVLLRKDQILDFRRLMGVEVVSILPMAGFLLLFSLTGLLLDIRGFWLDGFLIGLTVSLPVRFLTPMAMSSMSSWRKLSAGLPAAVLTTIMLLILFPYLSSASSPTLVQAGVLVASGLILSMLGVSLIIRRVENEGEAEIHHSPMELFRSFLDHWLRKTPASLEERLLSLSTEGSIETKILSFRGNDSPPVASFVVSNFHPGPYRDMGSGGLSSDLKRALEESHHGVVQVPHGISNHKLNIVSHQDIDRLLVAARENYPSDHPIRKASPMIREREGEAIVSGQAFGDVALVTVTLAPEEMEDLPTEVSTEIEREASRLGLEVLVIDAHNSLVGQTSITPDQAQRIIAAAVRVLGRLKDSSQGPFSVGSAYDALGRYALADGIGPGGLSLIALKTDSGTVSYVTIDGNNMQQGLRDRIVQSIKETGLSDAEVMTTDTHLVTGLVRSPLGYYPVGVALPTDSFVNQINEAVQKARASMQGSSAGFSKFSLRLHVLGSETFQSITSFIGRIARQIGRSFVFLEAASFLLAVIVLFVV